MKATAQYPPERVMLDALDGVISEIKRLIEIVEFSLVHDDLPDHIRTKRLLRLAELQDELNQATEDQRKLCSTLLASSTGIQRPWLN
jgi:hypothetical protein